MPDNVNLENSCAHVSVAKERTLAARRLQNLEHVARARKILEGINEEILAEADLGHGQVFLGYFALCEHSKLPTDTDSPAFVTAEVMAKVLDHLRQLGYVVEAPIVSGRYSVTVKWE